MSTSVGVNVLRYSALGLGVAYGVYHQRSITLSQKAASVRREYEHKQKLIQEAKEQFAKSKQPAAVTAASNGGIVRDPMDPKFDMEAYMNDLVKQSA